MKKIVRIYLSAVVVLTAFGCGGNSNKTEDATNSTPPASMVGDNNKPANNTATEDGQSIYARTCKACHQETGIGVPKAFPPLAKSDKLNADVNGAIDGVLFGRKGEITVNGEKYNAEMDPLPLTDQEVASVLTYVYSSWDNNKTVVTPEMVAARRKK